MEGVNYPAPNLYQQPLLDGWGNSGPFYDHRFLGYDRAPYGSLYLPAQPMGPYMGSLESLPQDGPPGNLPDMGMVSDDSSTSDDDNDAEDGDDVYSHVGLQQMIGKQMAVWCHRAPDTLAIFTPIPGDTLSTAVSFAQSSLQCDPSEDRALLLLPGLGRPVDPSVLHSAQPGSSLLVVPKSDCQVTLEVTQLKVKLQMEVSVTKTVRQVKAALQRQRGFPVQRTDLLFQDQPLENQRHLFDYHVRHGSTLFVMLHLVYDVRVTVETFWGHNYQLYVDPCMTTAGLLDTVLRRTISPQAGDVSTFFHLLLPRHALVMYTHTGTAMRWSSCLGLYGVQHGATFSLSTVALAHSMNLQSVPVVIAEGKVHNFRISKFDYCSVLALKLHGFLGYPVNLMRLFHGKQELDLARAAGTYSYRTSPVSLDLSLLRSDMDVYSGVLLTFRLGRDVEEELLLSPGRTVRSAKAMLEEVGVPNATAYDLEVDGVRLPEGGRIGHVVEEHRKPISLRLRHYPVYVHAPKNLIYKMNAHAQEALKVFKSRVGMKTGLSQTDYYMLMAGMPITDDDSTPVFQTPLSIGSSVFLMAVLQCQTFFLVWDDWLVKLRLPFHPQPYEIKQILLKDRNVPEGSLTSVANFLQWYFAMRATRKDLLHDYLQQTQQLLHAHGDRHQHHQQRESRPRKRRGQSEDALWRQHCQQIHDLQLALEKRYQPPQPGAVHPPRAARPALPQGPSPPTTTTKHPHAPKQGLYYAARRNGRWHRVNPEDLADSYLRAWSLPPDPIHTMYSGRHDRLKKYHSAKPDLRTKKGDHSGRNPEGMHSGQHKGREAAHTRKKRHRKKNTVKAR
ncbi:uncharacterized protein LOC143286725 [Babylonia areolata]|uniref:uncharacterized protein LOC143286725 n=1 Tax=Babylonia areolata TaxID=304850 RepID=UPI003FD5DFF0